MSFTPDSSLVSVVLEEPNHSGVSPKSYIVVHDIECPPGSDWAESLGGPNYLQNPAEQSSVNYIVDADSIVQGLPENVWAWGCGTPGSSHGIHIEQAGYASLSRSQWLGEASAAGSTYERPDGSHPEFTTQDAKDMASQMELLAKLMADIIKRHGWSATWMTNDDVIRVARNGGTAPNNVTTHVQITDSVGGTVHTDPGPNYPKDVLISKVASYLSGVTPKPPVPPTPPTPPQEDDDMYKLIRVPTADGKSAGIWAHSPGKFFHVDTPAQLSAGQKAGLYDKTALSVSRAEAAEIATAALHPNNSKI
jgi:hypothetical protein